MATVRLVSPDLVKRTNDLVTKVRRDRGIEKAMHDWIALMDATPSPQPGAEPPPGAAANPSAAAAEPSAAPADQNAAPAGEPVAETAAEQPSATTASEPDTAEAAAAEPDSYER